MKIIGNHLFMMQIITGLFFMMQVYALIKKSWQSDWHIYVGAGGSMYAAGVIAFESAFTVTTILPIVVLLLG